MGCGRIKILKDSLLNLLLNKRYDLSYIVESKKWVIEWVGQYITQNLNKSNCLRTKITTSHLCLKNQIIHFGSANTFLNLEKIRKPHPSNKIVVTCFHLDPNSELESLKQSARYVDLFHTSCHITKKKLTKLGIPRKKIIIIPLGVNLSLFRPVTLEEKMKVRKKLNLPSNKFIIGSFQKDGVGWGKGLKPKLIKGPDILVKVISQLNSYNPFVLLCGPARGYVKRALEKQDIPYKHWYLEDHKKISQMYNALDLYLITSRVEGGPKAILEAWASGVPVVSTKVGMVPDIATAEEDVLLAECENINQLTNQTKRVLEDKATRRKLVSCGLQKVQNYSWKKIAKRYYKEIYSKLLCQKKGT